MDRNDDYLRQELEALRSQQRAVLLAVRWAFALLLLILMALNIRLFFALPEYRRMTTDMLNGVPLPPLARFVFTHVPDNFILFALLNLGVPLACIVYGFKSNAVGRIIFLDSAVALVLFVEWQLLSSAVMEPLRLIIRQISS